MAGVPGFEPGMSIPKTDALPLGHTPTFNLELRATTFKPDYNSGEMSHKCHGESSIIFKIIRKYRRLLSIDKIYAYKWS